MSLSRHKLSTGYSIAVLLAGLAVLVAYPQEHAQAQYGARTYQCIGMIGGVRSAAVLQITPGGGMGGGPYVAGEIQNQVTRYSFTGELFGGVEGFVSMVELTTGQRIDRVWIGLSQAGFALRTEDGALYPFTCSG